jgi:hypothetical protein
MGTYFEKSVHHQTQKPQPERLPRKRKTPRFFTLLAGFIFVAMALTWADVIEWEDGLPQLKPARKAQLEKEKKEIDGAEQYALLALTSGFYSCALCANGKAFLNKGEVWKYGVTRKGAQIRYSDKFLENNKLLYHIQFIRDYAACLISEKVKLYEYPLLPENLARPEPQRLPFPPGNQQTK